MITCSRLCTNPCRPTLFTGIPDHPPLNYWPPHAQRLRVLVVDDEAFIRDVLGDLLREEDHSVVTAADGVEGLRKFKAGHFDLVLTDRVMPHLDGLELAKLIKHDDPLVPIILVTGRSIGIGQDAAVDYIVKKPFSRASLWEAICLSLRSELNKQYGQAQAIQTV